MSLFAFCLPAEHRGVQESRGAIERRRLIAVERRTENRAPCYDSLPSARLHLAPVLTQPPGDDTKRGKIRMELFMCAHVVLIHRLIDSVLKVSAILPKNGLDSTSIFISRD